jgi:acetylornithine deacetylase/succinyl-diaminopimelate desuccinylase-like protein
MADQIRRFVAEHRDDLSRDLADWVRIPSISADPGCAADVEASAQWFADALRATGFPTVEIWPTAGHPAVFAEWPSDDPDAVTVLVYGHHDVQPVDPEELWTSPPFEPLIVGEGDDAELRGRGAIDDKGQLVFHLLGLRAHLAVTGRTSPAVNLKFLVEGEEESSSPHFAGLLEDRRDRLACDVIVVSDTTMFDANTPSICTSMRGMLACHIDVFGPDQDLHSGLFGGAVPNPLHALTGLLAALHDADGAVAIPGFYDDVIPLTEAERKNFVSLPFDEADWLAGTARSQATFGEGGFGTLERIGARPTAEINGAWGGHIGPGFKTLIPAEAHAKVSFRLVAGQDPAHVLKLFRDFVTVNTPDGIRIEIRPEGDGVRPCAIAIDHPANQALARAMGRAFKREPLFTREGGSGPEADLADTLQAPIVFLGVGLPDDGFHAPNERARLRFLYKGAEAAAYLWSELVDLPRG